MTSQRGTLALAGLALLLITGIIVPFLIWGEQFEQALSPEGAQQWLASYGQWAWLAGIGLLVADIVLPIPGTVVMSALGWMYGWAVGGLVAAAGSFLSGLLAYGLCRWLGRPAARWIAGDEALAKGEVLFARQGGWLVALSRWAPVLPEAVACLAGIVRMKPGVFILSLACGSLPLGFAFAAIGHLGQAQPLWALILSAAAPLLLWGLAGRWMARHSPPPAEKLP